MSERIEIEAKVGEFTNLIINGVSVTVWYDTDKTIDFAIHDKDANVREIKVFANLDLKISKTTTKYSDFAVTKITRVE